jgi:hypothetical protein
VCGANMLCLGSQHFKTCTTPDHVRARAGLHGSQVLTSKYDINAYVATLLEVRAWDLC